jgi:hypothetical protein
MAEELLNHSEIGVVFQHVSRARVAKSVRVDSLLDPGKFNPLLYRSWNR